MPAGFLNRPVPSTETVRVPSGLVGVHTAYDIVTTFISYYHVLYAVWSLKRITEDGIHLSITNYFEENKPSYYSKYTDVKSFVK